jgi:hypothetical protein
LWFEVEISVMVVPPYCMDEMPCWILVAVDTATNTSAPDAAVNEYDGEDALADAAEKVSNAIAISHPLPPSA